MNRELNSNLIGLDGKLENVQVVFGSALTAYQGIVINNDYTFCIKYGHVAQINIRFTTPSSVSGMDFALRMIQLPDGFCPKKSAYPMMYEMWGAGAGTQCFIAGEDTEFNNHIRPIERIKANTDYVLQYSYITSD